MLKRCTLLLALAAALLLPACGRGRRVLEVAYISAPQVALRDRVAPVYNKVGLVKNGERVEVLDRERRFLKVRTTTGVEGWIEQRYTINQETFDQLQKLAQDNKNEPVQATGTTRNETNIHLEPARDSEHLYQLNQGAKLFILKRSTSEKEPTSASPPNAQDKKEPTKAVMEDWWLVRDAEGHTGWVLARLVDLDIPLDIAQYAEGQRIQAFFVLDEVADGDKKISEYLVLLSEPKDGMPFDYNQVRVFTWNVRRHRYETAYRERKLEGLFPITVGHESFDKEGTLPIFVLKVRDASGNLVERKYKLNTPIVRRVLMPGEVPEKSKAPRRAKRGRR
ncbi:MAG TPA: SH3 domain-containing protein [Terriglobales bacterium]|nr:SH3 domain-containing protein [Terriglobales bacterium]